MLDIGGRVGLHQPVSRGRKTGRVTYSGIRTATSRRHCNLTVTEARGRRQAEFEEKSCRCCFATHTVPNSYADTFDFVSPTDGLLSVTLHSPIFTGSVGIGFFAYQLSGSPAVTLPSPQADVDLGPFPISAGPHTLTVGVGVFLAPPGTTLLFEGLNPGLAACS